MLTVALVKALKRSNLPVSDQDMEQIISDENSNPQNFDIQNSQEDIQKE